MYSANLDIMKIAFTFYSIFINITPWLTTGEPGLVIAAYAVTLISAAWLFITIKRKNREGEDK